MPILAIALAVIAICAILWGLDCHRARKRTARAARAKCEEDARLDDLARELDKRLDEDPSRRRRRPALALARGR